MNLPKCRALLKEGLQKLGLSPPMTPTPFETQAFPVTQNCSETQALSATQAHSVTPVLSEAQEEQLLQYVELLCKWNKLHNLTSVRDPEEMITRHLLDCLTVLPLLTSGHLACDVGTGAGLPGLILAIAKPEFEFVLIDSQQKKMNFVQQVLITLGLSNVQVVCSRIEDYKPEMNTQRIYFDWILSRAFSSLSDFIQKTAHIGDDHSQWLAMKGKLMKEELAALPTGYTMEQVQAVSVPNLGAERHLILVKKGTTQ